MLTWNRNGALEYPSGPHWRRRDTTQNYVGRVRGSAPKLHWPRRMYSSDGRLRKIGYVQTVYTFGVRAPLRMMRQMNLEFYKNPRTNLMA